jgi:adenylosuccinate lyase
MIERYTRPEMGRIWALQNKYAKWLEVELLACEAHAAKGRVPQDVAKHIRETAGFDVRRIDEIEKTVKHDVIAFLTSVGETIGDDTAYLHMGMTSSDVLDTGLALQIKEASDIIRADLERLREVLKKRALEHKDTVQIGRSHGIHAEPTTFGLKLALWYEETRRNILRFEHAVQTISCGMISGAVGNFAQIDPDVEEFVCEKLGLTPASVSTQVIQRDRHAEYLNTLALIATTVEKIALEIRHLQRTEVREAEEFFSKGQKGSSAMPHKRNPIASENLCGLARLIRSNAMAALENNALWHERDISHSSVERVIFPDSTILIDYMLNRLSGVLENLIVYPERMLENVNQTHGLVFSQRVLLALASKGVSREDSYALVQRNAMRAWNEGEGFKGLLLSDSDVKKHLSAKEIEGCFDVNYYLRHVDTIFERVFGKS